jgi:PTH1 family peptidyl-tRNA hydrolase
VNRLREIAADLHRTRKAAPSEGLAYLVVGLGNPGRQYAQNRHNVGFQSVDHLARVHSIDLKKTRFKALYGQGQIAGQRVMLAKPLTFMNESGQAVGALSRYYKAPVERIIVIYDDIDLALGKIRVRPGGSSGGHNGIKSLLQHVGQDSFVRIRIGIGRPAQGDPVDYVLNDFDRDQEPIIAHAYEWVDEIIRCILREGVQQAMNIYNGRQVTVEPGA